MLLLHAGFIDGRLYLWGEAPPGVGGTGRSHPVVRSRSSAPVRSTYGVSADALRAAYAAVEGPGCASAASDGAASCVAVDLTIHLPVLAGMVVASSPLVAEPPASRTKPALRPFDVAAVELLPEESLRLLETVIERSPIAPGVIAGTTLMYWAEAFRLAVRLVVRGQFLPGLLFDEAYQACWEPVLMGDALRSARALAERMPDACGAMTMANGGASRPRIDPYALLLDFLNASVDALVLRAIAAGRDAGARGIAAHARPPERRLRRQAARRPSASPAAGFDEKWLRALSDPTGDIPATRADALAFYNRLAEWRRPLFVSLAAPWRLCFRLEEPAAGAAPAAETTAGGTWQVRYLLQSVDDPSLLIAAGRVWREKVPSGSGPAGSDAREALLAGLGRAFRLVPEAAGSLRTAAPEGYALDAAGAHAFLRRHAGLLEAAGFGVFLPAWWTRRGTRRSLAARATAHVPATTVGAGLTLDVIATVDWEIALGDDRLSLDELKRLAKLKAPLVRMRGEWIELNPEELRAALAHLNKSGRQLRMTVRDAVRMALGATPAHGGIRFAGLDASGALGEMLARLRNGEPEHARPAPEGLRGVLRPYQERGYTWLAFLRSLGLGACLADDMGLGKTIQTLALILADHEAGVRAPVLLICPTSVLDNWRREAARFTPELTVMLHHGPGRDKGAAFARAARRSTLVLTSYALLHRDATMLGAVAWGGVILDEAQNIKNPDTRQARAACAMQAGYRIALTGTPVENHVGDLWSIFEFLNPGFLGSRAAFRRDFFLPIHAARDAGAAGVLKRLTAPFILRRLKTDRAVITDLPEKQEARVFCRLTREQATLYKAVVDDMTGGLDGAEGIKRKGMVLAGLSKLKQVCNHPAQLLGDNSAIVGRSGKLERLTEMMEEILAEGDRALVFTQFAQMAAIIKRHLQETFGVEVLLLDGATPRAARDRMVERFQTAQGAPPIFVLSLKAGGSGLNLTAASHVFHFDRWWNPAVENQATDRAFRIGQRSNVMVHKFLCAGTVEERIDEMIEQKQDVAANVVAGGEAWLTKLSTAELKAVLALRGEVMDGE